MDVSAITSLVGSLGFPIVMCVLIFKYLETEQETHKEEITSLKDVISDLKVAITKLTERLGKRDDT